MSDSSDYGDEMLSRKLSDAEIEAALTNGQPDDPTLRALAARLEPLRDYEAGFDPETRVAEFAREAAALARAGAPIELAATVSRWRGPSLTPRLAAAAVAAVLFLGSAGVAYAADSAAPGDFLYGIDRALERVGIGDGGVEERLEEASKLSSSGDSSAALDHLAESIEETDSEASAALIEVAERLRANENGSDDAVELRSNLADLIEWMATTDFEGKDFGQGVAEWARGLGNKPDTPPGQGGENPGQGQGTPPSNPGQGRNP